MKYYKLLDELVEYREILSNFSSSIINNTNIINDYSSDEITIKENSFTFNSKLNSESLLNEKYKEEIEINNNVNNRISNFHVKFLEDIKN